VQDARVWTPPGGVLGVILAQTRGRVTTLRARASELRERASSAAEVPSLAAAIGAARGRLALIAEVKRRSPSRGSINPELDAVQQALDYEGGGAAAISVLTEKEHFGGSIEDLVRIAASVNIPTLRKDFCIDSLQLLEARACGAAAMLLIARALHPDKLVELAASANEVGLETLVEVRNEQELELALLLGTTLIGVNNRNLETLEITPDVSQRLIPLIPQSHSAVFESGIRSRADVELAATAGADAVLVGSALSAPTRDVREFVRSFTTVPGHGRALRD